ncbi:MAG: WS/DGAT/MGAT family O-acyltransferase [Frankiaceae bacterium]
MTDRSRDRLSALDVSFLYLEEPTTAMHVGGVALFQVPPGGFDHDRLLALIERRIGHVPRYRQKVRWVPGHLANPVWVDDPDFDIAYHVRRSALPEPGTDAQLRELVARIQSRHLDRNRPLWEMYLVEGLSGGRFAIIAKTHHAMVDGISAIDIGTVILDPSPVPADADAGPGDWSPAPEPSAAELIAEATLEMLRRPTQLAETVRTGVLAPAVAGEKLLGAAGGLLAALRTAARPAPVSPLNARIGQQRRYAMAATGLDDYKLVRKAHGGTVNDVVLATVAGALRRWLQSRGEAVTARTSVRALVPVSVRTAEDAGRYGNRVSAYLVDLPVGEPSPIVRLTQVSYAMNSHKEAGQSVGADAIVALSGFAPSTLHSLGARAASSFSRRIFNVAVTNVPGPQLPLYADGARMLAAYPVVPLAKGQAVSIGLTSYDGGVYYGLNADRDAMPDIDVLAGCIPEALAELTATVP